MTIETSTTIEPSDIVAIEFECVKCKAKTVFPVDKFKSIPTRCTVCDSEQWLIPGDRAYADLVSLGRIIKWFQSEEKPQGFTLRLRLSSSAPVSNGRA